MSRSRISITSCARSCGKSFREFSRRRARIFVYATTEPTEALLLGGNTATLSQGRLTQFGPTPRRLSPAARSHHRAGVFRPADEHPDRVARPATWSVWHRRRGRGQAAHSRLVPDGRIHVGFRPNHLLDPVEARHRRSPRQSRSPKSPDRRASSIVDAAGRRFVALVPGVKRWRRVRPSTLYLDPADVFRVRPPTAVWPPTRAAA